MSEQFGQTPETADGSKAAFLDPEPPHWAARGLAIVMIALAVAVLGISIVIRVPETVSSAFTLVPVQGVDPIRAPRGGVVAVVRVHEGQAVSRGDLALTIRSAAVGDRAAEMRSLEAQLRGVEESRASIRQRVEIQRRTDEEETARLTRRAAHPAQKLEEQRAIRSIREVGFRTDLEIQGNTIDITGKETEFKKTQHALAKELADRFERYHQEGAISWLDYKNREMEMTKLAVEVQQLERTLETARLRESQIQGEQAIWGREWRLAVAELEAEGRDARTALEKMRQAEASRDAEYREADRRLREESQKAQIRVAALREELGPNQSGELSVTARCTGTILRLVVKDQGAVVQEGELLAEIACSGGRLQAEAIVPHSGIGLVNPGQEVKFLYDAFPYQRYGVKYGTVRWVSPASVMVKDQSVFRILMDLREESVLVKGRPKPLLVGMGGTANIVVGRRSLFSYAFEPVRQLKENLAGSTP
jgi:multidrug efflux pump subunit AcrA (membrane-fusion protein)